MTIGEAFTVLGLPLHAGEEAVRKAYRDLSQVHHPDKPDGDTQKQARLNEAYDMACSALVHRNALVLAHTDAALQSVQKMMAAETAARESAGYVRTVQRKRLGPLRRMKHIAWLMTAISAGLAFLPDKVLPLMPTIQNHPGLKEALALYAVTFAIAGGLMQFLTIQLEHAIEGFSELLGDPKTCAARLAELLQYTDVDTVSEPDLRPAEFQPVAKLSQNRPENPLSILGPVFGLRDIERQRLIQLKSIQHGLLTTLPVNEITPDTVPMYKVNFKPSAFPKPPVPQPHVSEPLTIEQVKKRVFIGLTGAIVPASIAAYLIYAFRTWWAAVPILITLVIWGCVLDALERRPSKTRNGKQSAVASGPV